MRVSTGVYGLDDLLGGGFLPNTINVVLGSTGTGKTIFSLQYLLKGVEVGNKSIFVSFDMDEEGVIKTALALGWDEVKDYIAEGKLLVNKFYAENVSYVNNDLLNLLMTESNKNTRIVIDSFTPMISSLNFEMRNDVNWFFNKLRELGTALVTLEEPLNGDLGEAYVSIPMFLGDSVIQLKNIGYGEAFSRTLRIIKQRGSWHAEGVFPYRILDGIGVYIEGVEYIIESKEEVNLEEIFNELGIKRSDLSSSVLAKIEKLAKMGERGISQVITDLLKNYLLKK
jgi:KaiC/GvpD/RAD55 family RecA-like ATPase